MVNHIQILELQKDPPCNLNDLYSALPHGHGVAFRKLQLLRLNQINKMGRELADLPMKLLMPSSFDNIKEISFKTIPSVSKVQIKKVLESIYGFEVEKVRTLNMEGKKKRRGGRLVAKPNYKKACVTFKNPISIASDLYPAEAIEKKRRSSSKYSKSGYFQEDDVKLKSGSLDNDKQHRNFCTTGTFGQLNSPSGMHSSR
ncbi:hypothetical protein JCGZ_20175 [Jatropha curcas]|uniref:Large ribosomal subunit protein uL23m n=1 Tax=Jatropha curcas TaxID=180498 RepID=A0A067JTR1_JATCU|nr:uncharacterized protein LOC105643956 [Jatropha curcas]KDP27351.1 hypothetical protein JCGZ_20175 [Jatropha curcas]